MKLSKIISLIAIFSFSTMAAVPFTSCGSKSNCQNSYEDKNSARYFYPIEYVGPKEKAKEKISRILSELSGKVVEAKEDYIKAEFTSSIFKIVDDVELYFGEPGLIHLKSKSRTNFWDFGANKRRLGDITFRFHQSR